jgi:hypothetical protein
MDCRPMFADIPVDAAFGTVMIRVKVYDSVMYPLDYYIGKPCSVDVFNAIYFNKS